LREEEGGWDDEEGRRRKRKEEESTRKIEGNFWPRKDERGWGKKRGLAGGKTKVWPEWKLGPNTFFGEGKLRKGVVLW
jgi:hypothetical protein